MNLSSLLLLPAVVLLLKWTGLLMLGWIAHWFLRRRHARWRLMLWRSLLCFGLALPLFQCVELPGIKIPVATESATVSDLPDAAAPAAAITPVQVATSRTTSARVPEYGRFNPNTGFAQIPALSHRPVSWGGILLGVWMAGCAWGACRLLWMQLALSRLRRRAAQPAEALVRLTAKTQEQLGVRRTVQVLSSDAVVSPFVCGLWKPAILLPWNLAQNLEPNELRALLNHELAHVRHNDLIWCVAWQWLRVLCWFHPLVWPVPAAHNLACEQEADRLASGQMEDRDSYAQLLARLALRVLAVPAVETRLTANGSSQIASRLRLLGQPSHGAWSWRHYLASFATAAIVFFLTAGCETTATNPEGTVRAASPAKAEFKKVLVVVQDDEGKPIAGATILPTGFRVKGIHGADAYGWNKELFGPPEPAMTDSQGRADVRYPVEGIPQEKEFTGAILFKVTHPDFSSEFCQGYSVASPEPPIRLRRGILLAVSAYYGGDHQPVTNLVPILTDGTPAGDWQQLENGSWQFRKLSPGGHLLQLMGRLPSGEIVHAAACAFTAEKGQPVTLALELKPGIRLEGHLDARVPRPVKHGRVMMDVRPPQYPALNVIEDYYAADNKFGGRHFWHTYRPINEDGSFVFESVPPGEADVFVLGDGFTTKTSGELQNRVNGVLAKGGVMAIPQAVPLAAPATVFEAATEPTATLEFAATTKSGQPLENIWVGMYPSVFRMWGPAAWQGTSSESAYREMPKLSDLHFNGQTDRAGKLVILNLPAECRGISVDSNEYQVPLQQPKGWRDRHVRVSFIAGATNHLVMTLEPKGTDYIGSGR